MYGQIAGCEPGFDDGPERCLLAAVVVLAVRDARRGDAGAVAFLDELAVPDMRGYVWPVVPASWRDVAYSRRYLRREQYERPYDPAGAARAKRYRERKQREKERGEMPRSNSIMDAKPEDLLTDGMKKDLLARIAELATNNAAAVDLQQAAVAQAKADLQTAQRLQHEALLEHGLKGPKEHQYIATEECLPSVAAVSQAAAVLNAERGKLAALKIDESDIGLLARLAKRGVPAVIHEVDRRMQSRIVGGGERSAPAKQIGEEAEGKMTTQTWRQQRGR